MAPEDSKRAPKHQFQTGAQVLWSPREGPEGNSLWAKRCWLAKWKRWWNIGHLVGTRGDLQLPSGLIVPQPAPSGALVFDGNMWENNTLLLTSSNSSPTWTATVLADNFSFMAATLPKSRTIAASRSPSGSPEPDKACWYLTTKSVVWKSGLI